MNIDDMNESALEKYKLGLAYFKEGKVDKARACWETITREDDAEIYAKAQFKLGFSYLKEGNLDKVREYWEAITREDDAEIYAKARVNLGNSYSKEGNETKAREYWEAITREDDAEIYANARVNLGNSYSKEGNDTKARAYWEAITREDDAEVYANARFNLGFSYLKEGNLDKAREYWEAITREDDAGVYANARFNLGISYSKEGNLDKAREYWEAITREDDAEVYAAARFNLGGSYSKEGKIEQAREYWEAITREDDAEIYAKARVNLGISYSKEGNLDKAREYWEAITREDDAGVYATARVNLGNSYSKEGNETKAREYWEAIKRKDNAGVYANARFNLGGSYIEEGKIEQAREYWEAITREDDAEIYAKARVNLGNSYSKEDNEIKAKKYWNILLKEDLYKNLSESLFDKRWLEDVFEKITFFVKQNIKKNSQEKPNLFKWDLFRLLQKLQQSEELIQKQLHMDPALFSKESIEKQLDRDTDLLPKEIIENVDLTKLESVFAHYTRIKTAEIIIENGSFHLGVANYMNDLTEGKILLNKWKIPTDYNDNLVVFLTSFTFNENSLNQFRLYGKENGEEGSGVSLVVANAFFDPKFDPNNPTHLNTNYMYNNINQNITVISEDIKDKKDSSKNLRQKSNNVEVEPADKKMSHPTTIFRCIYLDPNTNHISVAHQSKSSFLSKGLSYLKEAKIKNEDIDIVWNFYIKKMNEITKKVDEILKNIENTILEIREKIEQKGMIHQEVIYEAIATTILPIIYLTKHAAFEEEAECRILYVTSIFDKIIQKDGDRVYVEYATNLADQYPPNEQSQNYLERIYLGPKADPRAELNLKKCWINKMRDKKMANNEIKIPTIIKSDMPLA
ncbi:hypothetical protein CIN_12280 [Commensalibacter intestini A911]|uniref:Uncharacterized protein n=1 Tax=Commensalibacter intestini A911 TaxID=1088868 RepID=G6F175_9PROT|nr:tetratricopeptide repeat protein [Commensalibacter intestini]EHD13869.1 hypothetical protein CIN_12280 [Commensalibacter intestini A911]